MPRSSRLRVLMVLCTAGALAGCPFGSSKGDGDNDEPMVIGPDDGSAGQGDGSATSGSGGGGDGQAGGASGSGEAGAAAGSGPSGGVSGSTVENDGGAPFVDHLPLEELPAAFAQAICDALLDCVGASKLRDLTGHEDCATAVEAELRAKDFARMEQALAAGHVLYDPSELPACSEGIRALGCGVLTQDFPEACVKVLEGNVPVGSPCAITAECEGTAFCTSGASCPSTCQPLLGDGDACDEDGQCGDDLACLGGKCGALAGDGEPCSGGSGGVCKLGLSCLGSTDTEPGACTPNAEVQAGALDDACEPGGTLCREGLSCVFDGGGGFHCQAAVTSGAECYLGLPGQCPVDEYCDSTEVTMPGTCQKLPGDGEACVLGDACLGGHACVVEGMTATCHAIGANGEACVADQTCRSGHCVDGTCAPPPACP